MSNNINYPFCPVRSIFQLHSLLVIRIAVVKGLNATGCQISYHAHDFAAISQFIATSYADSSAKFSSCSCIPILKELFIYWIITIGKWILKKDNKTSVDVSITDLLLLLVVH